MGVAAVSHGFLVFFDAPRGTDGAKLACRITHNWHRIRVGGRSSANTGEVCCGLRPRGADPNRTSFRWSANVSDFDVVVASGQLYSRISADRDIIRACRIVIERLKTIGRIKAAGRIGKKRTATGRCVIRSRRVLTVRIDASGCVLLLFC